MPTGTLAFSRRCKTGGGKVLIVQNKQRPSVVLDEIAAAIPTDAQEMVVAAAYVTKSGSELLFDRLHKKLGAEGFAGLEKQLITTGDYGLTEPQALERWIELGAHVEIVNAHRIQQGNLNPAIAYHPKVYAFRGHAGDWHVVCGSSNLTSRGLTINSEAVSKVVLQDAAARAMIDLLREGAEVATEQLVEQYRELRNANPPPPQVSREVSRVPTPPTPPPRLTSFGDAVSNGDAMPKDFQRLWVQTLTMSGGSGSQLELPRGANAYFGFNFTNHIAGNKVTIGQPALLSGQRRWTDRILSWHGHNRMERINMPTPAMSGYTYDHSAVCFVRKGDGFEFLVARWDSDLARSWRGGSTVTGHVYKLGENSPRICGLLD
jgi:HKD family nuclease